MANDMPETAGDSYWVGDLEFATLKVTGEDNDNAFAFIEVVALPGAEPPPHVHHDTDELYRILDGSLTFLLGDDVFTAREGDTVFIPKGTLHAWRNASEKDVHTILLVSPAGFDQMIKEVGTSGTFAERPVPKNPTPEDVNRVLELGRKYGTEYPPSSPW